MDMNILLVEDNIADAELLKELVAEKEGAPEIYWVTDGGMALDYVFQRESHKNAPRPDAILLDLSLPLISGYDVLKEIKKHAQYSCIPVIILSTSCNPADKIQCSELGAEHFLSKPRNLAGYEQLADNLVNKEFPHVIAMAY